MAWEHRYVGLPFADGGEQNFASGVHCWGLVRLVLANECGIDVPVYGELSAKDMVKVARRIGAESNGDPWVAVLAHCIREFDVAVMTPADGRNRPGHVGIVCGGDHLLHITEGTAAVKLPLSHWSVKGRVLGFRRHRLLCEATA